MKNINADHDLLLRIKLILAQIDMPSHLIGYQYFLYALYYCFCESVMIPKIGTLYAMVAEEFKTSKENVERSMRTAVDLTWLRESSQLSKLFNTRMGKVRNSEFLNKLLLELQLRGQSFSKTISDIL